MKLKLVIYHDKMTSNPINHHFRHQQIQFPKLRRNAKKNSREAERSMQYMAA